MRRFPQPEIKKNKQTIKQQENNKRILTAALFCQNLKYQLEWLN